MANVRLTLAEAAEGFMPETCMKCGAEAEHWVKKRLAWHPPWLWVLLLAGPIPFVIVAAILTKRAMLIAPLCTAHRRHWAIRTATMVFGLLGLIGMVVLLIVLSSSRRPTDERLAAFVGVSLLLGFFGWIIALIFLNFTAIRALEITDYDLILQGVSDKFVDDFDDSIEEDVRPVRRSRPRRDSREDEEFRRR